MQTGGITDIICHFAGYLQIYDAVARTPEFYFGDPHKQLPEDGHDRFYAPARAYDFDELVSLPTFVRDPALVSTQFALPKFTLQPYVAPPLRLQPSSQPLKRFEAPDDIALAGPRIAQSGRTIAVEYQDGGLEYLVGIRQINLQDDQDLVTSESVLYADGSQVVPPVLHVEADFAAMVQDARDVVPEGLPDLLRAMMAGTGDVIDMFSGRRAGWAESGSPNPDGSPAEHAPEGRIVDGVAGAADPAVPTLLQIAPWRPDEAPAAPVAEATLTGLRPTGGIATLVEAGQNQQINAAVIADVNEAAGSMVVGGDYFYSRGIVQVNVLVDDDFVDVAVAGGLRPLVQTQGNEVHNIAEFVTHLSDANVRGAASTPLWSVDVVSGDFYDVKTLVQFNDLNDNDRTVQGESGTYFDLKTGANQQLNLTKIYGLDSYDIIVIGGNYNRADWIYQYNVILDTDSVKILSGGDGGDTTTVTTGFDRLTNSAKIETYDAAEFKPALAAHSELIALLDSRATVLTSNPEWNLDGNASGKLKVLYVPGNYYDLNVITQVNFLKDADQSIQATAKSGTTQGAAAGGNSAINEARILDPGLLSKSNYLAGHTYEESVLIQTNIISDSDKVKIHDTSSLVPEVVAFAGLAGLDKLSDHHAPALSTAMAASAAHNDHFMSHIMF